MELQLQKLTLPQLNGLRDQLEKARPLDWSDV